MPTKLTVCGLLVNRLWLKAPNKMILMKTREILAANLERLMAEADGDGRTQIGLKRASGVAQATIGRILRRETDATIDTVQALALAFELHAWQLLVPNLDVKQPPTLRSLTKEEERLYDAFSKAYKTLEKTRT